MMKGEMHPEGCMRQEAMRGRPEMRRGPRKGRERAVKWGSLTSAGKAHGVLPIPVGGHCVSWRKSQALPKDSRLSKGVTGGCFPQMPPGSRAPVPVTGGAHTGTLTTDLPPALRHPSTKEMSLEES